MTKEEILKEEIFLIEEIKNKNYKKIKVLELVNECLKTKQSELEALLCEYQNDY